MRGWLVAAVLVLLPPAARGAASEALLFQNWLDEARGRMSREQVESPQRQLIRLTEALLRGQDIEATDTAAKAFRVEQMRGRRLGGAFRQRTVWSILDKATLVGNARADDIVWPSSLERWSDEKPLVPTHPVTPQAGGDSTLQMELELLQSVLEDPALGGRDRFWAAYQVAWLSWKLGRHFAFDLADEAPPDWRGQARLLACELRFAEGERSPDLLGVYEELVLEKPRWAEALWVRRLQVALELGEDARVEPLLTIEHLRQAGSRRYVLAEAAARLRSRRRPEALLRLLAAHGVLLGSDAPNAQFLRQEMLWAASYVPLDDEVRVVLTRAGEVTPALCGIGDRALAQHRFHIAKPALAHCAKHASTAAQRHAATADWTLAAAFDGDAEAVRDALENLSAEPVLAWRASRSVLIASGVWGGLADSVVEVFQEAIHGWKLPEKLRQGLSDGWRSYRRGGDPLPVVRVDLPSTPALLQVKPPQLRWHIAEAYRVALWPTLVAEPSESTFQNPSPEPSPLKGRVGTP